MYHVLIKKGEMDKGASGAPMPKNPTGGGLKGTSADSLLEAAMLLGGQGCVNLLNKCGGAEGLGICASCTTDGGQAG